MITYMDYIQRCFYNSSNWNEDNTYEHILRTPRNLLEFKVSNDFKLSISSKNTEYSYSSITLSQLSRLSCSLSYMFSSIDLGKTYTPSKGILLEDLLQDYRDILHSDNKNTMSSYQYPYLLYGKMYFPSQFLEGMLIKRLSEHYQLIVKFINTPKLNKLTNSSSIFTFYLQRQHDNCAHDFVYSTREALMGYRCMYHFTPLSSVTPSNDPSLLSIGCEIWYATNSMSPGVSTTARYTTQMASAGNKPQPLTMTLAANPLLGTVESTYAIKTDLGTTLSSKYTFNIYSYESDLSVGAQFLRKSHELPNKKVEKRKHINRPLGRHAVDGRLPIVHHVTDSEFVEKYIETGKGDQQFGQFHDIHNYKNFNDNITKGSTENKQENQIAESSKDYVSSLKIAGSLGKKNVIFAWEGKFKDWIVASGAKVDLKDTVPKISGYGLEFQYSS